MGRYLRKAGGGPFVHAEPSSIRHRLRRGHDVLGYPDASFRGAVDPEVTDGCPHSCFTGFLRRDKEVFRPDALAGEHDRRFLPRPRAQSERCARLRPSS